MLVARATGGIASRSAHAGAPAWARTAFTPTARNSVLLPDMFEPVTSRNEPAGPISTSLATRVSFGNSGCPSWRAWKRSAAASTSGIVQSGWS